MGRLSSRQRRRYTLLGALATVVFLYIYLSTDALSSSSFNTTHYNERQKHVPVKQPDPLVLAEGQLQFDFKGKGRTAGDPEKAQKVAEAMKKTFWKYKAKAWGEDEIMPITGNSQSSKNGWASTIAETLTTTALMGLEDEFMLQLSYITQTLDFTTASELVDPSEAIVRYLAPLVSAVDLIDAGVLRKGLVTKEQRTKLLGKATELAELLGPAFDSPNGMLWPRVNFTSGKGCMEPFEELQYPGYNHAITTPARAGTNFLEYRALTKLTEEPVYVKNATRAWTPLVWNKTIEQMPGLLDSPIDIVTGSPLTQMRSWGQGHGSYYEYLIKANLISPKDTNAPAYRARWVTAVESLMEHLTSRGTPPSGEKKGQLFLANWSQNRVLNEMSQVSCFAGGNILLGGKSVNRLDIIETGLELISTCRHTYINTDTQVGPEVFSWIPEGNIKATYQPQWKGHIAQVKDNGFWIVDARGKLRPETIESYFYAYRITGDKIYQEWAWEAFNAILNSSTAENGFAEISDVTRPPGPDNQNDKAERYWGAETLKYLYLIFADDSVASLDQWVFNTEAHPFRIIGI